MLIDQAWPIFIMVQGSSCVSFCMILTYAYFAYVFNVIGYLLQVLFAGLIGRTYSMHEGMKKYTSEIF